MREPAHVRMVDRLLEYIKIIPPKRRAKQTLEGKTFVFTGELESFSRAQAKELVRERGGTASESVSKKTDYVVVGESPGDKYEKAKKLGVKALNEAEFKRMIR